MADLDKIFSKIDMKDNDAVDLKDPVQDNHSVKHVRHICMCGEHPDECENIPASARAASQWGKLKREPWRVFPPPTEKAAALERGKRMSELRIRVAALVATAQNVIDNTVKEYEKLMKQVEGYLDNTLTDPDCTVEAINDIEEMVKCDQHKWVYLDGQVDYIFEITPGVRDP